MEKEWKEYRCERKAINHTEPLAIHWWYCGITIGFWLSVSLLMSQSATWPRRESATRCKAYSIRFYGNQSVAADSTLREWDAARAPCPVSMSDAEASSGEGSFSYWTPPNGDRDGRGPHPMLVGDYGPLDEDSSTDIRLSDEPFQLPSTHDASSATVDAVYLETNPKEYETAHRFAARDTSLLITPVPQR